MRKFFIVTTTALMLSAVPAHAQLLGGGLGGGLGGTLGGTLGGVGSIGSVGGPIGTVTSTTSGTLRGAASTSGSTRVNRHTGHVHADRSLTASSSGTLSQAIGTPAHMIGGTASAGASGSGSGSLDAQLVGTNAVGSTVQSARGMASGTVRSARGAASSTAQSARGTAGGALRSTRSTVRGTANGALGTTGRLTNGLGSVSGSGSASGSAADDGALGPITGSGEAGGSGSGGFQVTRGMPVLAPGGARIGKVRQVFNNSSGEVQQMLVTVGNQRALLPATNFTAHGNSVLSAMTESQIQQVAARQASGQQASASTR
jgi:hypothetical protein